MTEVINLHPTPAESKGDFCLTPTARHIMGVLSVCQQRGFLGVIVGEPGTGKTTAVNAYVEGQKDAAVACRMTRSAAKLQPGLVKLATEIGAYVAANWGSHDLYQELVSRTRRFTKFQPGLIILDEAQHMEDDLLEGVRDLYDETRIGIALVGNQELTRRWTDQSNRRRYNGFAQFRGRIGPQPPPFLRPKPEDIEAICAHHGIREARAVKLVKRVAALPGALQKVRNLFDVARDLGGEPMTHATLQEAAMVVGVGDLG